MDLLRALAIAAVVVGHWLVVDVASDAEQGLRGRNVLSLLSWAHPATWVLQVMPIFFLVGGYANAASLMSHRRQGSGSRAWWVHRTDRLLRPTTALLAVLTVSALLGRAAGVDPQLVAEAVWVGSISLWFLLAYLAVVVLTPAMHALHHRFGLGVPAVLACLVGLGDVAGLGLDLPAVRAANYLLAWLAIHQIGFAWRDGRMPTRPRVMVPVACAGLTILLALTVLGPYPISMVGIPGEPVQNTAPPTLALLALATVQTGVVLSVAERSNRWLRRRRPWTAVVGVNSIVLTVFLWHMAAVVVVGAVLYASGLLPTVRVGSGEWFVLRLPWLVCLAVVLTALVAVFGRIETRPTPAPTVSWSRADATHQVTMRALTTGLLLGLVGVLAGLMGITFAGVDPDRPAGLPIWALVGYFCGASVLRVVRMVTRHPTPRANRRRR